MSLFESIKKVIFYNPMARKSPDASHASTPRPATPATSTRTAPASSASTGTGSIGSASAGAASAGAASAGSAAGTTSGAAHAPGATAPQPEAVDVEAVLEALNEKSPQKLNWRTSIVDLMKLVGLDSSLKHRQELAVELGYTGDKNDSAAMNIWLHKAVMRKLAENGGKVPATLQ